VAIAVIGSASSSYLSIPLGIALTVLGVILLLAYALNGNNRNAVPATVQAGKHHIKSVKVSTKPS
jgi:hypothetical protein